MSHVQPISDPAIRSVVLDEPKNGLLGSMSLDEQHRLAAHLCPVSIKAGQVLHKQGEPIRDVYFPGGGVWALVKTMEDGQTAQVATVGNEGLIGASAFFGDTLSGVDALVQLADVGTLSMPVDTFIAEMNRHGAFYNHVIRYSSALMSQIMQTTVCNGLHSAQQRCCRWLLMTQERAGANGFPLTHEFLATMLGVRRPTVTLVIAALQRCGIVEHTRGRLRILDLSALEDASCECHRTVRTTFRRLMPDIPANNRGPTRSASAVEGLYIHAGDDGNAL